MKKLDKERRKKKKELSLVSSADSKNDFQSGRVSYLSTDQTEENIKNNSSKVHTEIRTDEFVVRLLNLIFYKAIRRRAN